jgi:hypothetical protein
MQRRMPDSRCAGIFPWRAQSRRVRGRTFRYAAASFAVSHPFIGQKFHSGCLPHPRCFLLCNVALTVEDVFQRFRLVFLWLRDGCPKPEHRKRLEVIAA